jgi:biotin carboxyl carrier protein
MMVQVGEGHDCAVVEAMKMQIKPLFETAPLMMVQVGEGHECAVVEAMKMQIKPLF